MLKTLFKIRFSITCILLFGFVFVFCGCQTTDIYTIGAEEFDIKKHNEIYELKLKDSSRVKSDYPEDFKYYDSYNNTSKVFVYTNISTTHFLSKEKKTFEKVRKTIPLEHVAKIKFGKDRFDLGKTVLVGFIAAAVTCLFVYFAIARPQVAPSYSIH